MKLHAVHGIGHAEARARHASRAVGVAENLFAQAQTFFLRLLRLIAMNQFWKIELKFMFVARSVWALHFAELALKASVHDFSRFWFVNLVDISVVFVIEQSEKARECVAIFKAHATA